MPFPFPEKEKLLFLKKRIKFLEKENYKLRKEIFKLNSSASAGADEIEKSDPKRIICSECNIESAEKIELITRMGVKTILICKNCNKTKMVK